MRHVSCLVLLSSLIAPAIAQERMIEPGLYEVVTRSNMAPTTTVRQCLTTKDIVNGLNPAVDKGCKRVRNTISGGRIDFATTCPDMTTTSTGTYAPTSYTIDGKVVMAGDDPVTMESHIAGKRVAETCKAG